VSLYRIFELEGIVDQLYAVFHPPLPPDQWRGEERRAFRPLVSSAMGCLVTEDKGRQLVEDRTYFRVDLDDFMEYATTALAPEVTIGQFPEGIAVFYEFLRGDGEGYLTGEFIGQPVKVCPIDSVITRSYPFLSISVRFFFRWASEASTKGFLSVGDQPIQDFVTLTLAATAGTGAPTEQAGLEEWDRYAFSPPYEDDPQWRFHKIEGVYTNATLSRIANDRNADEALKQWAKNIEAISADPQPEAQLKFEVARLMLNLPTYVAFMYDLVTEERRQVPSVHPARRRLSRPLPLRRRGPTYRIIRSIRIIRPKAQQAPAIQWRSRPRLHAVRGHWRTLSNPDSLGKAEDGVRVAGRTWVRDHTRGELGEFVTDVELRDSNVVINIKQTLQYARDVIHSAGERSAAPEVTIRPDEQPKDGKPSIEWIADERAKLSAGLRYLILKRDGFRCQLCGASRVDSNFVKLEVDHKKPVSAWGLTEDSNLWTLCTACNKGKSNRQ
jgi:HNH endonuclease